MTLCPRSPVIEVRAPFFLITDSGVFSLHLDTTLILYGHEPLPPLPLGGDSSSFLHTYSVYAFLF